MTDQPCAAVDPEGALAGLAAALEHVQAIDLGTLTDPELAELAVGLGAMSARLDAARVHTAAAADARRVWAADRARGCAAWLSWRGRRARADCAADLRLGRALRTMPLAAAALAEGAVTASHARVLAAAVRTAPDAYARDEALLVHHARTLPYPAFVRAVTYWCQLADPDGVEADAEAMHQRRRLHLSALPDGSWRLDADLSTIDGTIVHTELARLEAALLAADWSDARARLGDAATATDLARTPAQRRADALVAMAQRSAAVPPGSVPRRPLFTIVVDHPTLAGRICQLTNGLTVTPGQAAVHLTRADIERVVFDGTSRVLDVGVTQRFFTGATRRAVEVRDLECSHPGCHVPLEGCDVDHVIPWAHDGPTTQANGRLLCPPHHPGRHQRPTPRAPARPREGGESG